MKRRDFISMAVTSPAIAAIAGKPPPRRRATKLTVAFVGGTYLVQRKDGTYLAVQPKGEQYPHRAFLVAPDNVTIPNGNGETSNGKMITLSDGYPLHALHPELGRGKDHLVYCLDRTEVVVGRGGQAKRMAQGLADFSEHLKTWTPIGTWQDTSKEVPYTLCSRFLLTGGIIDDGKLVNLDASKANWRIADSMLSEKKLGDVALFTPEQGVLTVDKGNIQLPEGDVRIYVFGGPAEGKPTKKKGDVNDEIHHTEALSTLYSPPPGNTGKLHLKASMKLVVLYDMSLTHPCDAGVRMEEGRPVPSSEGAVRLIPPDTEFCVNGEGPPEGGP